MRVVIVPGRLPPYVALAGTAHAAIVALAFAVAGWTAKEINLEPSMSVSLVGALPGSTVVTPSPTPPAPEPPAQQIVEPVTPEPVAEDPPAVVEDVVPIEEEEEKPEPEQEEPPKPKPQPPPQSVQQEAPTAEAGPSGGVGVPGQAAAELGTTGVAGVEGIGDEFDWYKVQLVAALGRAWRRPVLPGLTDPIEVPVSFVLSRAGGRVSQPQILAPSGIWEMDDSVRRAMNDAQMPPIPPALTGETKTIRTAFVLFPGE